MKENPFPKLTAEVQRRPENQRLLDELGAYLTSVAMYEPKDKNYGFYEFIGDDLKSEIEKEGE